jgi:hypothetical protein
MTRSDASLIAEELYKLISKNMKSYISDVVKKHTDEYLDAKEAASFVGLSVKTFRNRKDEFPHIKTGKKLMFSKNGLIEYMDR